MQVIVEIDEAYYKFIKQEVKLLNSNSKPHNILANGIVIPKGHGRLFDEQDIVNGDYKVIGNKIYELEPIIEADKEYEVEVITRGNCMICGKELTEGLFLCKECEDKANSRK